MNPDNDPYIDTMIGRGERTASALEDHLSALEAKVNEILSGFEKQEVGEAKETGDRDHGERQTGDKAGSGC